MRYIEIELSWNVVFVLYINLSLQLLLVAVNESAASPRPHFRMAVLIEVQKSGFGKAWLFVHVTKKSGLIKAALLIHWNSKSDFAKARLL